MPFMVKLRGLEVSQSITTGLAVSETGATPVFETIRGAEFGSARNAFPNSLPNWSSFATVRAANGSLATTLSPLLQLHAASDV